VGTSNSSVLNGLLNGRILYNSRCQLHCNDGISLLSFILSVMKTAIAGQLVHTSLLEGCGTN
jgi:hypothetical protein